MSGRPALRPAVAALVFTLTLGLTGCGPAALGSTGSAGPTRSGRRAATGASAAATVSQQQAVSSLLERRSRAVTDADAVAWSGTVGGGARTGQQQLFGRLAMLRPARWSYRATRVTQQGRSGVLDVAASLTYRLAPGGPDVVRAQNLTVSRRSGGWRVTAVQEPAPQQAVDLWDLGPVERRDGGRCVVVGAPSQDRWVRWLAEACTAAAVRVDAAAGREWPRRTVLVVPADVHRLARLLDRTGTAGLDVTAAETIGPRLAPAEAVLVNPGALRQLRPVGRRVVLTHELVHVAMRAHDTAAVPTWLDEGLADEIAYRGTGLNPVTIAGPAVLAARAGHYPTALPAPGDFDAAGADPALAYARAWSAADTIAAQVGLARLVQLHRMVGRGVLLEAAMDDVLRVGPAGFLPLWRSHLHDLANHATGPDPSP